MSYQNWSTYEGHVHAVAYTGTSGNISETVLLLQTTNRKWFIAYQIVVIRITLSDLQGHLHVVDIERGAVSARAELLLLSSNRELRPMTFLRMSR